MTPKDLSELFEGFVEKQRAIMSAKGQSYSGVKDGEVGDRLANFKRVAHAAGVTPLTAWLVYFLKHVDSISTFVRTGHESEGPESRLLDLANYAVLGLALVKEMDRE